MSRKTKDWISEYLRYTDNTEPPRLYREWVALSCIAAVLQRKIYLKWGDLTFYPNMYTILVGPPGASRKGTAMGVGARMLKKVGVNLAAEATTREALIQAIEECTTFVTQDDGTMKAHSSLTILSSELTVFVGYNNLQLISDLTDWFDCGDTWKYRTKNMGVNDILGMWVNILGATTPEAIRKALPMDAIGLGLASRMIFVFEEKKEKVVAAPFLTPSLSNLYTDLVHDLEFMFTLSGPSLVTDEFIEAWIAWYENAEVNPPFDDKNFDGYISRRPTHVLKMCMLVAASEHSTTDDGSRLLLTDKILSRAVDILERTEVKMPNTFRGVGSAATGPVMTEVMLYIERKGTVSRTNLYRRFYTDFRDTRDFDQAILGLKSMRWITETIQSGQTLYSYVPNSLYSLARQKQQQSNATIITGSPKNQKP